MEKKAVLTEEELQEAQEIINNTPAGEYKLSELYGDRWPSIAKRNVFGMAFKNDVISKRLTGIEWVRCESDNHNIYLVTK